MTLWERLLSQRIPATVTLMDDFTEHYTHIYTFSVFVSPSPPLSLFYLSWYVRSICVYVIRYSWFVVTCCVGPSSSGIVLAHVILSMCLPGNTLPIHQQQQQLYRRRIKKLIYDNNNTEKHCFSARCWVFTLLLARRQTSQSIPFIFNTQSTNDVIMSHVLCLDNQFLHS